jgi:hypothetical protein
MQSFMVAKHIFQICGAPLAAKSPALSGGLAMPGAYGLIPGWEREKHFSRTSGTHEGSIV